MSAYFTPDATRRTLLKAMASSALAGPLLGSMPYRAHAEPTTAARATRALFQGEGIPPAVLAA